MKLAKTCAVIVLSSALLLILVQAEYAFGQSEGAASERMQECRYLGIIESECSDANIITGRKQLAVESESNGSAIMLSSKSHGGKFGLNVFWEPDDIGLPNDFNLFFYDSANMTDPIMATYTIMIMKDGIPLAPSERADQIYTRQDYVFDEPGSYTLSVVNINNTGDSVDIPIQVTPEFPSGLSAAFAISVAAIIAVCKGRIGCNRSGLT